MGVYPRPRGGTIRQLDHVRVERGLSPPTRGNRWLTSTSNLRRRSIPAHAGEPRRAGRRRAVRSVYPRPRGGTNATWIDCPRLYGLSPPTRGNLAHDASGRVWRGSIPAHAGEPAHAPDQHCPRTVYPRPRGGTSRMSDADIRAQGLSPPTRGNPPRRARTIPSPGSIPAHAGEPTSPTTATPPQRVYPRPRGGTGVRPPLRWLCWGLSPPTRGNPG